MGGDFRVATMVARGWPVHGVRPTYPVTGRRIRRKSPGQLPHFFTRRLLSVSSRSTPANSAAIRAISRLAHALRGHAPRCPSRRPRRACPCGSAQQSRTIPAAASRPRAVRPSTPRGAGSAVIRWVSVPPVVTTSPSRGQPAGEHPRVGDHLMGVRRERRRRRLAERDGLGGDGVHLRAALREREDRPVDPLGELARRTGSSRRAARAAPCAWWRRRRRRTAPGLGAAPPATRPMGWAASAIR